MYKRRWRDNYGKIKKFIMNKNRKVNVQVSMLTCGLIIFSCLVIYLVTSGVMISMLADAYNERANLTFTTIESHFDSRLLLKMCLTAYTVRH